MKALMLEVLRWLTGCVWLALVNNGISPWLQDFLLEGLGGYEILNNFELAIVQVLIVLPVLYLIMRNSLLFRVHKLFSSRGGSGAIETPRDKRSSLNESISRLSRNFVPANENTVSRQSLEDKELFLRATDEVDKGKANVALWATAMAVKEGDEEKAKYEYIRLRVEEFKIKTPEEIQEEEERREREVKEKEERQEREIKEKEEIQVKEAFERKHQEFFQLVSELETIRHKVVQGASSPLQGPWKVREPQGFEVECQTREKFGQYAKGRLAWAKEKGFAKN